PELIDVIRPIGDQAAGADEDTIVVDRGQLVAGRPLDDQVAMKPYPTAPGRDLAAIRSARKGRGSALDLSGSPPIDPVDLHPHRRRAPPPAATPPPPPPPIPPPHYPPP